mgnify:CR=1 FL=1
MKVEKPQVVIPVFPGTNCEVDSARAFERAGAIADIHIINTLSEESLNASIRELAEKIKKANIIFIPGASPAVTSLMVLLSLSLRYSETLW